MANKTVQSNKKPAPKNDKAVLIALIAALVIVVAVAVVLIVSMANDKKPVPEENFEKKTFDTTPVEQATRTETTGAVDMTAVRAEIDSRSVDDFEQADEVTEYVMFVVKGYGSYVIKLRPDVAPVSSLNFRNLVAQNFYDGSVFHRVMKGFMIQGGGAVAGFSGSLTPIKGEFASNGLKNDLSHIPGVISMARTTVPDSATSQFFISNSQNTPLSLAGNYAAFGYVDAGMDTVIAITDAQVTYSSTGELSAPTSPIVIEHAYFVKLK